MKNFKFIIFSAVLLSAGFFFIGCSKSSSSGSNNNNSGGGGNVSDLVASFTNVSSNASSSTTTTYSFSYDGQNRLIQEQISDGRPTITIAYDSGTVTKTQGTAVTIYTLNPSGFATSDNQGNTFIYDGNGFLTSETNPSGASTSNTISNGNIVTSVQTTSAGVTTTYAYSYLSNANSWKYGFSFLGMPNTNVQGSETINGFKYPIAYTFDSHGRVLTEKIVSGATTLLRTYSYVD